MSTALEVRDALITGYGLTEQAVTAPRERRVFADVPAETFRAVFMHAVKDLKFFMLCSLTGLDEGATIGLIYHLAGPNGTILSITMHLPKTSPVVRTVSDLFPSADVYERELVDLLGVTVEGLPPGNRYPMPDDFPTNEHPLRKDWKPKE